MSDESNGRSILGTRAVTVAGAALGGVLALAAVAALFAVEHSAVVRAASLEEGASGVVTVDPAKADAANEGKLVYLTGDAVTDETPTDPQFGVSAKGLRLVREVEGYQWKETKTESKKKGDKSVTYEYTKIWSKDKPVASSSFHTPAGHENPAAKPYADESFNAAAKVGAFTLSPDQVKRLPAEEALPVTDALLTKLPEDLKGKAKPQPDGALFVGANADAPQVGDARVHYKIAKPGAVSVVAKQTGNTLTPYATKAGHDIDLIKPGKQPAQTLFESEQSSNRAFNWVIRVAGYLLLALGVFLMLRLPASSASGVAPDDTAFNVSVAIFAAVAALPLVLLVIGLRRVFSEPGTGGGLLAVGAVALAGVVLVGRRQKGLLAGVFGGGHSWSAEDRARLKRIALEPDNAGLRMELASALVKKGDPMGEFIRVENDLATLPETDPARDGLSARSYDLQQTHGRAWFQPLRKLGLEPKIMGRFYPGMWMHNGIIDTVLIDLAGVLPERAEQLFAAAPGLRVLEFHNVRTEQGVGGWKDTMYNPNIPAIVRLPQMEQIGSWKTSSLGRNLADLQAIASSPHLKNLTSLDFSYNAVGAQGAVAVAQSSTLRRLQVLELRACNLGEQGAAALAGSPGMAQLTRLNLGSNAVGPAGATALANSAHLAKLQSLILDENAIGAAGARALAASPHLRGLTELDLTNNDLGPDGAQALAGSPNLARLTTLKLSNNLLGAAGVGAVGASSQLGQLKVLALESNDVDGEGARLLAASGVIRQLEELSLSSNRLGDAGFKALAAWPGLARVKKLSLRQNGASPVGVKALADSPYLGKLEEIDLGENEVGLVGAQALAGSPVIGKLKYLWLQDAQLTSQGQSVLRQRFGDAAQIR
jgi:Ran GTPase-activating protein (RanGAP) involved in mRNA processing and transport